MSIREKNNITKKKQKSIKRTNNKIKKKIKMIHNVRDKIEVEHNKKKIIDKKITDLHNITETETIVIYCNANGELDICFTPKFCNFATSDDFSDLVSKYMLNCKENI